MAEELEHDSDVASRIFVGGSEVEGGGNEAEFRGRKLGGAW